MRGREGEDEEGVRKRRVRGRGGVSFLHFLFCPQNPSSPTKSFCFPFLHFLLCPLSRPFFISSFSLLPSATTQVYSHIVTGVDLGGTREMSMIGETHISLALLCGIVEPLANGEQRCDKFDKCLAFAGCTDVEDFPHYVRGLYNLAVAEMEASHPWL